MSRRAKVLLNSLTAAVLAGAAGIQLGVGNNGNACLFAGVSLLYLWIAFAWSGK